MLNPIYLAHLEDLIAEARANPKFNFAAELAALSEVISEEVAS